MDSFTYELIAERLGIHLNQLPFNTTAVIIDNDVSFYCNGERYCISNIFLLPFSE